MAYTKTLTDADTYFLPNNHIKAFNWRKFNDDEKEASLNQAQRMLEVSLGRELADPDDDDTYRDDYACFEQALYMLEAVPRQSSAGIDGVVNLVGDDEAESTEKKPILVCPEAKQFLMHNTLKIVRG